MGIFARRHRAPADETLWRADGGGVTTRRTYDEDGPDCVVAAEAYGARFVLPDSPASAITVWVYPVESTDDFPGTFRIGYRIEYQEHWGDWGDPFEESRLASGDDDIFDDLAECSEACLGVAKTLAETGPDDEIDPDVAGYFEWDGDILSLDGDH